MGHNAIITGAAGGIGQALCRVFKQNGYRVIATDVVEPHAHFDAYVAIDLDRLCRDDSYRARALDALEQELDGRPLGALVNNAAVQILGSTEQIAGGHWQQTLNVNLLAPFMLIQGLLAPLEAAPGAVINISSIHATLTKPGFVCYATSKAALSGLTRALGVDLGPRIRVNAIEPAAVATPMLERGFAGDQTGRATLDRMHPIGRVADPEEVARAALFLASADAAFITGETLRVDGGIGGRLHDPT